jgi:D-serine deaminase-like pyridoxal phosphate-dependent protein
MDAMEDSMTDVGLTWAELDTPALWIDLDKTERNIARLGAHFKAAGVNWRPHTKGIKVPAIAHKLLRAGAIGVTCAKVSEAEVMAAAGIPDILIANEVVTPTKITRWSTWPAGPRSRSASTTPPTSMRCQPPPMPAA